MRSIFTMLLMLVCLTALRAVPISGTVFEPDGKPLAGAKILFVKNRPGSSPCQLTDAQGRFSLEVAEAEIDNDRSPLRYTVYHPKFALAGGQLQKGGMVIKLQRSITVVGSVVDISGKPVVDAGVRLSYILSGSGQFISITHELTQSFFVKTNNQGQWRMSGLPQTGTANFYLADQRFQHNEVNAELHAGTPFVQKIIAKPGATLAGRVVTPEGKPAGALRLDISLRTAHGGAGTGARTADDGSYRITGLAGGVAQITVEDPAGQWAMQTHGGIQAKEGTITHVADIVLSHGILVTGKVIVSETGAPIPSVGVWYRCSQHSIECTAFTNTRSDGSFAFRVPPGNCTVALTGSVHGYLPKDTKQSFIAKLGETESLILQLSKGLSFSGIAVDEDGHPLAGVLLSFIMTDFLFQQRYSRPFDNWTKTDPGGKFSVSGFKVGKVKLQSLFSTDYYVVSTGNETDAAGNDANTRWSIVSPKEITLPLAGELRVVLRRIQLLTLLGRVVTPDGQPVIKADLTFSVRETVNNMVLGGEKPCASDAQGQFRLDRIAPTAQINFISAHKVGYRYRTGGEISLDDAGFHVADILLLPLNRRLRVRVVDAAQRPVAGAQVLALESLERAVTDADGHYTFSKLPEGQVMVLAAKGMIAGSVTAVTGDVPITILLVTRKRPPEHDMRHATAMVRACLAGITQKQYAHMILPMTLAGQDPELALQLATEEGGYPPAAVLPEIVSRLAAANPTHAATWAPVRLSLIGDRQRRAEVMVVLGLTLADSEPDMAAELYRLAKPALHDSDPWRRATNLAKLAALAAKLKKDEAHVLIKQAIDTARGARASDRMITDLLRELAIGSPELAASIAAHLPDNIRIPSYVECIHLAMGSKPAVAQRILAQLSARVFSSPVTTRTHLVQPTHNYDSQYEQAVQDVIAGIGKRDPAGALALARGMQAHFSSPYTLALAASFQSKDVALRVLREAVTKQRYGPAELARFARMIYPLDPRSGDHLLQQAFAQLNKQQSKYANTLAVVAYYGADIDSADCRVLLEERMAQWLESNRIRPNSMPYSTVILLARAMAAIDPDRAWEFAQAIPDEYQRIEACRAMVRYLLAPANIRADLSFERIADSGRETWPPGVPTGW